MYNGPMTNILDFWPIDSPPRPNQIKALEWIAQQTSKHLILEAPVGSGKSLIGLTYSRWLAESGGSSFILTPQRILQKQYEHELDNTVHSETLSTLYGKSNYTCVGRNTTCDVGSIIKPRCEYCPYSSAVRNATTTPNLVLNYKLALLLFEYTDIFDSRELLVLDECHTAEEHLCEFDAISVHKYRAEKFGLKWKVIPSIKIAHAWLKKTYLPAVSKHLEKTFEEVEELLDKAGGDLTRKEIKQLREYSKLESHLDEIAMFAHTPLAVVDKEYVLVHDKEMMKFKQLTGANNFKKMLAPMARKTLMMSSTIPDYRGHCRELGIDINDAAFLSIESDFPIENRPVYYMPQMKMNASWSKPEQEYDREKMLNAIRQVIEMHKDESGIIHTGNFKIAQWLVDNLNGPDHQVIHHNPGSGDDRGAIINQFTGSVKPTILISPSITEGLDLREDQSRFAIFAKVPFGFLGDQWIKKRMEMSTEWYQRRALIGVIQGGGRIVRSKDDHGTVYILDGSWGYLMSQTRETIPQWWRDAYQVV